MELGELDTGVEVLDELGHGGEGEVFRATQHSLERTVALKRGKRAGADGRLMHEARTAARLDHPNIVPVYEA